MPEQDPLAPRRRWMAVLARARGSAEIEALLGDGLVADSHVPLRRPETGLVMVQGRAGGSGPPFNLGEMTVTRCTIRDAAGRIGHGYVPGRDRRHAELAAMLDAALQDPARAARIEALVVAPLEARQRGERELRARKAAGTQVQFFTLATMRT